MAELEFRDGKRIVPDYFPQLMAGMPLNRLTYEEAVARMDQNNVARIIDTKVDVMVQEHFVRERRR